MKKMWKHILWGLAVVCLCGQVSIQAIAQEDITKIQTEDEIMETVDVSEMVFQAGGYGDPMGNYLIETYAVSAREQLKTAIAQSIQNDEDSLSISNYNISVDDIEEVKKVYAEVLNEHPELFYVDSGFGYNYSSGIITRLYWFYDNTTDEERQEFREKLEQVKTKIADDMTDVEKALVIHDYLAQNCAYAYKEYLDGTLGMGQAKNVYNAYGALVDEKAVCQGYALAYSALLRTVGISSEVCVSREMNHAWNVILIDNEWYHVDVTWDDPVWNKEGQAQHEFFLLSDAEMLNRRHSGWADSVECISTTYDSSDYWWNAVTSQIYIGDKIYYIEGLNRGFQLTERTDNSTNAKYVNNSYWEVWDGGGYWLNAYSYLSCQGDYLYFNDKLNLYAMNVSNGTPQVIYTYDGGDGYIYGAMVYEDGTARLNISQTPNKDNDDYITVDLSAKAPVLEVNYAAGTISTTAAMEYSTDGGNTWKACIANMKLTDFGWSGTKNVNVLFRIPEAGGLFESDVTTVVLKALAGTTNGEIKCFGDTDAMITIKLIDGNGTVVATTTVDGDNTEYGLERVNNGTYTMQVSKENHVTREYTVTVGDEALTQDVELHLIGDVTGDGALNARDKKILFNHISGSAKLDGYDLLVGDVTSDGAINARDKKMLYNHIAGSSSLWE